MPEFDNDIQQALNIIRCNLKNQSLLKKKEKLLTLGIFDKAF